MGNIIPSEDYNILRHNLTEAHYKPLSEDRDLTDEQQQKYDHAKEVIGQALDKLIGKVEKRAAELIATVTIENAFEHFYVPQALRRSSGFDSHQLSIDY